MKLLASLLLLSSVILFSCSSQSTVLKDRSLGQLDLTHNGQILHSSFSMPKSNGGSFVLLFPEGKVIHGKDGSKPNWPLELMVRITKSDDPNFILVKTLNSSDYQFTNWHSPANSILLNWKFWSQASFVEGEEYEVLFSVKKAVSDLGTVGILLHWIEG